MNDELRKNLQDAQEKAQKAQEEWFEDAVAGLMAAGVPKSDILVKAHPPYGTVCRTEILVRGEPKYGFTIWLEQTEVEGGYLQSSVRYRNSLFIGDLKCPHIPGVRHE